MSGTINQRNVTRNQSTADYSLKRLFIFGNDFQEAVFNNNSGGDLTIKEGILVKRNPNDATQVIPAVDDETLGDVVGIVKFDGKMTLSNGETLDINYGKNGDIDETYLELPDGVTLDTFPTDGTTPLTKTVKDILHALGFNLNGSVQNTKFDN